MQKIIKLETENTPLERWTENSACEIYSHDTNNGQFEIEVMNEALTDEMVTALFIFEESESVWRTTGTIEENKIKFKFDTTLITQDETVLCVLYLDNERENNDFYRFNFKVKVSEIDKLDNLTVKERFFKNNLIIDRLDVVTKDELQEILKHIDLSSISTDGLLTEEKANGLYAKISELEALERQIPSVSAFVTEETLRTTKNDVVAEINNRLESYALKTSIPEPYNDTNLVNRVSDLEQKQDKDTIYNDEPIKERLATLENSNFATKEELAAVRGSQPNVDNLVTKKDLENMHYLTTHQDLSEYAKKSELYNDTELKARVEVLEQKTDKDTVYDDKPIKDRLEVLENKVDNDTIYDDTEVKRRLTEIESKPAVDTSVFVTDEKLSNYALKSELPTPYNDTNLSNRVTALESKAIEGGAYDDSDLRNRVVALESKEDKDTIYNDTELRNRVTELENKPPLDISNFVTNQVLESKNYITEETLNNKGFAKTSEIPAPYNDSEVKERLTVLENKQDKDTVYNDTELKNRVSELEQRPIVTPYNDTALSDRVTALENKQDNDTVYNDSELRQRVEVLENKPPLDTSKFITEETLESKNYLTTPYNDTPLKERIEVLENKVDKDTVYNDEPIKARLTALESKPNIDLTGYATKQELKNKVDNSDYDTFKGMVVTKGYLEKQNFLTEQYNDKPLTDRVIALENKQDNDTIYDDSELKRRVTTLETKTENFATKQELHEATEIDYSNIVTTDELEEKHYVTEAELNNKGFLTQHQDISKFATKDEIKKFVTRDELPQPYNDTNLSNRVTVLENKADKDTVYNDTELRNRVATLESRPNIEVSNFATKQQLSDYALKTELPAPYNDSALVSRVSALEIKQDKDTVYNDTEVKRRLTALESRPTAKNGIRNALVIGWQDIYIQNMRFTSQINLVDVVNNVTLRNINGLDIKRVNNATYGYVIFNNRTKQFTLEILETDLSKKTSDDYLITVMWNNGYYTDNGALKNNKR